MLRKKGLAWSTTKHIFDSERGRREPLPHGKIYASTATGGGCGCSGLMPGLVSFWDIWSLLAGHSEGIEGCW